MSTYDELLAAVKAAWLAYMEYIDDLNMNGWGDETEQAVKKAELSALWDTYKAARAALGGAY